MFGFGAVPTLIARIDQGSNIASFNRYTAVTSTLEETSGNWAEAARRLGMDRSNLHHMAHRLGVQAR